MKIKKHFFYGFIVILTSGLILIYINSDRQSIHKTGSKILPADKEVTFLSAGNILDYKKFDFFLYFPNKGNTHLVAQKQSSTSNTSFLVKGQKIINSLIKGPDNDLLPAVPKETVLNALYITDDKTAYVDLSDTIYKKYPCGVQSEYLTVYSIVNSLILNICGIESVKILIMGKEQKTLAGHIDIRFPFKANMLLIK